MPCQDYLKTRRRFLKAAGATATLLGMPVNRLLSLAGTARPATAEHVILFWMGGGMSHLDTWDPKPGRPTQGEFNPINTAADGIQISEIFPQVARQMKHASLIRSIAGTNGDHGRATYELQTSYAMTPNIVHPGIGSVIASQRNSLGALPAYISISGMAPKAGYLGQSCEAYFVGQPGERDPYLAFPEGITGTRGGKRLDALARMNARTSGNLGARELKASETALNDAVALMQSPALKAFELDSENPDTIARYGATEFGRGALLARKLVETGVRFVQVNRGGFDNHGGIFPAMRAHGEVMDPAIASLLGDLKSAGLLSKTLVVVLSEFGRTPRVNDTGGRDHHASCFSCLMAGGGITGGTVIGSSDKDGIEPAERPVRVPDLHATICHALGIDPMFEVSTPTGRPMTLVKAGAAPVTELFA